MCALMCGDSVPVQWQESLASPASPLTLRRRPGADLWRGEGTGDMGRMTMRRSGRPRSSLGGHLHSLRPPTW